MIEIKRDSELMVSHVEADEEEEVEFVDAWLPADAEISVIDSGRIIIPDANLDAFTSAARKAGLDVQTETIR